MRRILLVVIVLLGVSSLSPWISALEEYEYRGISIFLFADGVARVEFLIDVNPSLARINVTALGSQIRNLIVRDQSGDLLLTNATEGYLLVSVLGSRSISVEYTTPDLTGKDRATWTFEASLPGESNIRLPEGATILGLEPIPTGISIAGESTTLSMPAGHASIRYVLGIVGTKEHSLVVLSDAGETISGLVDMGLNMSEAETMLEGAWEEYNDDRYTSAEEYAKLAKDMALEVSLIASEAKVSIDSAVEAVDAARASGRTSRLDEADAKLEQAQSVYAMGDYAEAASLAEEALEYARMSKSQNGTTQVLIVASIGALIVVVIVFVWGRKAKPQPKVEETAFDIEPLFDDYPMLRLEEKEILRYMASSGGGVFLSELRDRFGLPRSTAWRMMRRLEDMGVVGTEMVGRETFVKITILGEEK